LTRPVLLPDDHREIVLQDLQTSIDIFVFDSHVGDYVSKTTMMVASDRPAPNRLDLVARRDRPRGTGRTTVASNAA
jgi:hypothetical protein